MMADAVLFGPDRAPVGRWELAIRWPKGRRSIVRMSSRELDAVPLVAVTVQDTSARARRAAARPIDYTKGGTLPFPHRQG